MMVEIQPRQQQDANANATVPGYEVQTITMDMGPDSTRTTTTEDRDVGYSGEDLFLEEKKVSFVEDWIGLRGMRNSKKRAGNSVQ